MANTRDVVRFEVSRALRRRSFWLASVAPLIMILAVYGISYLSDHSANQQSQKQAQSVPASSVMGILDQTNLILPEVLSKHNFVREPNQQTGIEGVKDGQLTAFFYYPKNAASAGVTVYEQDQGLAYSSPYDPLAALLLKDSAAIRAQKVIHNNEILTLLAESPNVNSVTYKAGVETHGLASIIVPGLFMVAFLTLMVLLAYLMIQTTTEEKENRAAEILLTTIRARKLILGKIYAIFVLGGVQLITIIVPLSIAYLRFKNNIALPGGVTFSQIPVDPLRVALGFSLLAVGLVMYTGILVGIGAMFPSASDASRFLGMFIIWAYLPIYTLRYLLVSPHALVVTVFSYFPLTAPTTALIRNATGDLTAAQALPILALLAVCGVIAVMFAVRSFRYGAMEYGRRLTLRDILR